MQNVPPDTGASIKTAPVFSAAAAISFETDGSMVLESMSREPFFTFLWRKVHHWETDFNPWWYYVCIERETKVYLRMPLGPVYTSMTLGLEGSMVIIRSALSATSAGLSTIWGKHTKSGRKMREKLVETVWKFKKRLVYVLHSYLSTQLLYFLAGLWEHISSNDWVSVVQQVLCHWVSHIAQTNKPHRCLRGHRPRGDYK